MSINLSRRKLGYHGSTTTRCQYDPSQISCCNFEPLCRLKVGIPLYVSAAMALLPLPGYRAVSAARSVQLLSEYGQRLAALLNYSFFTWVQRLQRLFLSSLLSLQRNRKGCQKFSYLSTEAVSAASPVLFATDRVSHLVPSLNNHQHC